MEPLLTLEQLAAALGLSVQTLYNRRSRGESLPPTITLGRRLRFIQADVRTWLDTQRGASAYQAFPPQESQHSDGPSGTRRRGRPTKTEEMRKRAAPPQRDKPANANRSSHLDQLRRTGIVSIVKDTAISDARDSLIDHE